MSQENIHPHVRVRRLPGASEGKKYFKEKFGNARTEAIFNAVQVQYSRLMNERMPAKNKILRFHEEHFILPGLALYLVLLDEYSGDTQAAMGDVEEVVRLTVLKQTRLLFAPLKWVRNPFALFRRGFKPVMKAFPAKGWTIEYLENSPQCIAFNITHCYYQEVLTRLGRPELTGVFCRADDAMAEHFPPQVRFERSTTIGKGGELCDFCYRLLAD